MVTEQKYNYSITRPDIGVRGKWVRIEPYRNIFTFLDKKQFMRLIKQDLELGKPDLFR